MSFSHEIRDVYYIKCPECGKEYQVYNSRIRVSLTCHCGHKALVHVCKMTVKIGVPIE